MEPTCHDAGCQSYMLSLPECSREFNCEIFCYAVDILNSTGEVDEGWSIFEEDLVSLNSFVSEENFYTGETIQVRVDPETGEGEIIDDD